MKLRYFYKIDHNREPILGSNVRRKSKPAGHQWKEIVDICCTTPPAISCLCGPRFFVQLDNAGKPVDQSLIKRFSWPKMTEGIKYLEIQNTINECCTTINWTQLIDVGVTGTFSITINGILKVLSTVNGDSGTIKVKATDTVEFNASNFAAQPLINAILTNVTDAIDIFNINDLGGNWYNLFSPLNAKVYTIAITQTTN
mgnify:CR=1 FL=1